MSPDIRVEVTTTVQKLFTLEEANALLPRLATLLDELRDRRNSISDTHKQVNSIERQAKQNGHNRSDDLTRARKQLSELIASFDTGIKSIADMGCELKDLDTGLLDFQTMREGRVVYLCWKTGEPEISYWHELEGGFAGRQLL